MHIDCESCPVRDRHCADCMVTVLLEMPAPRIEQDELGLVLDDRERRGVKALFSVGLISEAEMRNARAVREQGEVLRVTG